MESGASSKGAMFIDATYEGDLMAKAGVSYHVGREANSLYGETINGLQIGRREASSVHQERRSLCEAGRSEQRARLGRHADARGRGWRRRQPHPGLQLPHVQHDDDANRVPFPKPRKLRRKAVRTAAAQLRGRRSERIPGHPRRCRTARRTRTTTSPSAPT
jgi:hypothetical protein